MGRTLRKTYWLIQVFILNVYGSGLLSWDDLCEVVLDIEVSLNHRPLSYVEDDPQFPTLKPSSLLFLNANILPELEPYRLEDRDLRKRAKFLKATKERNYDNSTNGINFTIRKVNLMFVFIVVVWIFFFNKYMIQNPVFFVYNVIMLSIVYATVLWANFFVKLLMSSAKAVVNSFDECNVFERAAQSSVIVYDNKLNNSNDEVFSINTVCNCRSRYDKFVYFNRPRTHGIRVRDREPSRIPKKRITRILKKSRKVRRLLRTYIGKSIPKSSRMHLFTNKAREKIYAHGIRCENKGTMKYPSSAVRRKYP